MKFEGGGAKSDYKHIAICRGSIRTMIYTPW